MRMNNTAILFGLEQSYQLTVNPFMHLMGVKWEELDKLEVDCIRGRGTVAQGERAVTQRFIPYYVNLHKGQTRL